MKVWVVQWTWIEDRGISAICTSEERARELFEQRRQEHRVCPASMYLCVYDCDVDIEDADLSESATINEYHWHSECGHA